RMETDDSKEDESGTYALATLGENETIARLATGIKRFPLPDEFNYIKIYQRIAADRETLQGVGLEALQRLTEVFENRRQYPRAAEYCRQCVEIYREAKNTDAANGWQSRLDQIVGNWGRFEAVSDQPAGKGATVEYRFRNGREVKFTAHEVLIDKLLADVMAYLKGNPGQVDGQKLDIGNFGYRLVEQNEKQYLGREVASWEMAMEPREKHFDKRVTVTTPLSKAGAYLLKAVMTDGNTSQIIIWLNDTAIVKKPLPDKTYYFVADAISGKPIERANVEFFGYQQKQTANNRFQVDVSRFAEYSDADGQVMTDPKQQPANFAWLIIARTKQGRLAYLGFTGAWYGRYHDQEYNATKVYAITDRPVYRPKQPVHYKFWVRHAKYDAPDVSTFAGREFTVEIHNPKGEKIVEKSLKADEYGGMEDTLELPEDAALGVYQLVVTRGKTGLGGGSFRVEEYKKPEFEVTVDAPTEPVMLGEKIEAVIKAKYYFGSPVTSAKVKYKVTRTSHSQPWFPPCPWDWLYGPGYWWFAYDYDWYPGWRGWGCSRPMPFWWPRGHVPPEVVAEREVEIGADGTVKVEIDTAVAKAIHPDRDHSYTVTAEVVDQSRRTIVGSGNVLVARKPFKVYAWVHQGYYRVGEVIDADFAARTLDGKGVQGKGTLELLKITYKDNKPVETPVQKWDLSTNDQGRSEMKIKASQAGQYRLSYKVTDAKQHAIEGGYLFTVIGQGFDGADFRFNHVEVIPDKREYAPGEKVSLQINTDRVGSTVLLFVRPANGVYLPPRILHLEGKSTTQEIEVEKKDMPNFFIEAVTVADGRVYSETREIVVPPESRVLTVEVKPSSETYRPGEKATVDVTLRDLAGKPFVGSTVIAIYDKSVEYISGGSNVPDIKEFFWKWRRSHHPRTESNLGRWFQNLVMPNTPGMNDLGVFGGTVAEELSDRDANGEGEAPQELSMRLGMLSASGAMRGGGMGGPGGMPMARRAMAKGAAPEAPMAAAPMDGLAAVEEKSSEGAAPGGEMVEPTVRTKFADTALWVGKLTTEANGTAQVQLDMPENLTTWRIKVWGMGHGTRVGQGQTDVVTRKDLIIRMQAPRFFVQTDEVVLSANVHNYLKDKKSVRVVLELDGPCLEYTGKVRYERLNENTARRVPDAQLVDIEPNGEARVDWLVKVLNEGEAVVRMKAITDEESDAMEMRFPCYVHGMLKTESFSGAIRPDEPGGKFTITVPKDRRPEQSRLEVRYSPTLAGAMVDALPYLVEYPYGCTEQTLNRFLPTVITQKVLLDMKLDLDAIRKKRTNLNAQEIGDDQKRAEGWKRYKRNPVFDQDEVRRMVKDGVKALTEMQVSDGGWGWFSGYGEHSYPHTTATVVHGLQIAQANDVALVPGVLERGVEWLKRYQNEEIQKIQNAVEDPKNEKKRPWKLHADNVDALVYMVLIDAGVKNDAMREFLYRDRTELSVYSLAIFGLALEKQGDKEKLDMILRNISQYVVEDNENQTAWLKLPEGCWWYWYGSDNEAQAYYLKLLARTDPKGQLASRLVKYLLNNRKNATYWNSTRDTAVCVEAMADFLRASGEDRPEMTVEVRMDGERKTAVEITPANLFTFDNAFVVEGKTLTDGPHQVEIKRTGRGPLYFNAYQTNFTLEDFITRAGLEIKVNRKYYRLKPVEKTIKAAGSRGQAVDQKVEKYDREELPNLATLKSGDLVEIELEIDSKNDYEYLVFEDMKPAGFEPVDLRSGYNGNALGAYMEFRDNRVVFFVQRLARGKHSVAYRMRAEIPGRFSALPTAASAMYAPELKANSDEIKLGVEDK
ncbi:MAG: MG2 domain-containing protein, partial [Planctomycetia bacterium]|nr:MG2 domain-containing protein [Planctomycetia bacterium]